MAFIKKDDGMLLLQKRCLLSQLLLVTLTFAFTQVSLGDEELIVPPADAPMYRLSNLRIDDAQILVFDFKRTRAGKPKNAYVQLGGKSKNATLQVHGNFPSDQSGTFRLQIRIGARGKDYELYLKTPAPLGKSYLVSNVIRVGNPGTRSRARAFTAKENEAICAPRTTIFLYRAARV